MTNEQKKQVRDALVRYASTFDTQALAAESLQGISASTISLVKNNNWELLSERLWYHIARQVGFYCGDWNEAGTNTNLLLRILFSDAQHYAMTYGIAIGDGLGKTFTAGHYTREHDNVYYLSCSEEFNRRSFITALLNTAGIEEGKTVPVMMEQFTAFMGEKEDPLLILDDAHKLKDRVLHLVVLLSNSIIGKAGIVIMGADALRTRIVEGVRLKRVGFEEIYKSIGRRFITLSSLGPKDVELICRANGVYDDDVINHIKDECKNDLHVAARLIQQYTEMKAAA